MTKSWNCCRLIRSESHDLLFSYDQVHFLIKRFDRYPVFQLKIVADSDFRNVQCGKQTVIKTLSTPKTITLPVKSHARYNDQVYFPFLYGYAVFGRFRNTKSTGFE